MDNPKEAENGNGSMETKVSLSAVDPTIDTNGHTNGSAATEVAAANGATPVKDEDPKDKEKKKDDDEEEGPMVGVLDVFRYSDRVDKILMIIGAFAALVHGASIPAMIIVFGNMLDAFLNVGDFCTNCTSVGYQNLTATYNQLYSKEVTCDTFISQVEADKNLASDFLNFANQSLNGTLRETTFDQTGILKEMTQFAIYYAIIGVAVLIASYFQLSFWALAAKRQARKIRLLFFKAAIRQDMSWFDVNDAGELSTRLTADVDKIENGIGEKVATLIMLLAQTLASIAIGFAYGWKLTLVVLACSPAIGVAAFLMDKVIKDSTTEEQKAYAQAGGIAEEVISSFRTVVAFGGQQKECERYEEKLDDAKKQGVRKGTWSAMTMGIVMMIVFLAYALGFWYGSKLVIEGEPNFTVGNMLIVFFSILIASFGFGQAGPSVKEMAVARGAAHFIFNLIERTPPIDIDSTEGEKLTNVTGNIAFRDVHFEYPSRPEVKVLQGLNLDIPTGKTVALVGASGCGKSTTVQLIQRFYDASHGQVTLDGHDIKDLNLRWLRSQIGIVSQEPILFATTIAENIRYGRDGITEDEMVKACQEANAHSFISELPDKYETLVGSRGAQLSGGQKQRIAIARALVNTPKVLLLDEATSALDTESEATVQEALDKVSHGRTTVVIAHRLTTVQNADVIVAFKDGVAAESGTHKELMELDGVYASLVRTQLKKQTKEEDESESEDEELERELERVKSQRKQSLKETPKRQTSASHKGVDRVLSVTSEGKAEEEESEEEVAPVGFCEMMSWNAKEWYLMAIGILAALVVGGSQPAFAIIFSKLLANFISCDEGKMRERSEFFSLMFVVIAIAMFLATALSGFMFSLSGERLTARLRALSFRAYLRQDVEYFDDPKNSTGAVTTRLASEVAAVQGATGSQLDQLAQAAANLGVGIIIAFYYSWKLTLAILAFVPLLGLAGFVEMRVFRGGGHKNKEAYEESGKTATETIENIRTVQSLSKDRLFYQKYEESSDPPYKKEAKLTQGLGITYGVSQGMIFFAYAALFTLGAYLIEIKDIDFEAMMITFSAVVFGAMSLGQATSFAPNAAKGKQASGHIKALLERQPKIDSYSTEGDEPANYQAQISFSDTQFTYPTRRTVKVLRGLNISVEEGQTLALVGSSGCGKSTTVQLIERFYDPDAGNVLLQGKDLRTLNVAWLRRQIGIVSQEPVLFDRSIADNIAYGANERAVNMEEIKAAAQKANIHNFIASLPAGYDTRVGDKGTQLSGGQKQRVAIARALVRNPKILLLDEATSALDSESEQVVQEALDQARIGRTTIVIAHRLSTIQNADKIAVIRHGHVSEVGKHDELLAKGGFYHKLQNIQKLQE